MKKQLFILMMLIFSTNSIAQFVAIPDTNFRNWLNANGFSSCMNGNLMDTTCTAVLAADSIDFYMSSITNLEGIQYFDNLLRFTCTSSNTTPFNKRITNIPAFPAELKEILIAWHNLTSIPTLPDNLEILNLISGPLLNVPSLPGTLKRLWVTNNAIDTLPALPSTLKSLICYSNQLTFLPPLPNGLTELRCGNQPLVALPALPDSLRWLLCEWIPNLALPVLPDSLEWFDCTNNDWTSLPTLPDSLDYLTCMNNQLSSLPPLPPGLKSLNMAINPITTFPQLPASLVGLHCDSTNLTTFPASLPPTLQSLSCSNNPLINLPYLPSLLRELECSNTLISEIPQLGDDMLNVKINDNPNLTCFPIYLSIQYLYWANTQISCLPNAGYIGSATPPITNLPICLSVSGCDYNWSMYGKIFNDTVANCLIDTTESLFKNLRVNLKSGGNTLQSFIFNTEGYYSFKTGFGTFEISIDTTNIPFDVICPATGHHTSTVSPSDSTDVDLNFGLICKPGYFDLQAKSISPNEILFPGSQVRIDLKAGDASLFYGINCTSGIGGTVEAVITGPVTFAAPAPGALTPTSVLSNIITWNISDFSQVNPVQDFNIIVNIDSTATVTDTICIQLSITPTADSYPLNNLIAFCQPVHNSLDPNAKSVFPAGDIDTTSQWLTYTIFFQNTGNAPARNIYLLDTLDSDLNLNTFEYLSSSHDPMVQLLPSNILRFSFPNIYLADSTNNEPESHGYVQYRIKTKSGLAPGKTINNTAHIFFDFNPAVVTNSVQNVITLPVGIEGSFEESLFNIYPNPTSSTLLISFSEKIENGTISILDITGKIVRYIEGLNEQTLTVSVRDLAEGVYVVRVEMNGNTVVKKLIIVNE